MPGNAVCSPPVGSATWADVSGTGASLAIVDQTQVARLPIFQGLNAGELSDLLKDAHLHRTPKNTAVFEEGGDAHSFFVLVEGRLRVVKVTPDGAQVLMRYMVPGDIFGIARALGRTTYPATAVAVVDSVALAWPSTSWERLSGRYPIFAAETLKLVGSRLQEVQTRVIEISTEEVQRRIARALLRLARQAGRKVDQGVEIDFPISRQDVAQMTGTTLHTVSRILSAWDAQGLVSGGRQRIVVKDPHRLLLLAEKPD